MTLYFDHTGAFVVWVINYGRVALRGLFVVLIYHSPIIQFFASTSCLTKNTHIRKIPMTDELCKYYFILQKEHCIDGKKDFLFFSKSGNLIITASFDNELKRAIELFNMTAENFCLGRKNTDPCKAFARTVLHVTILQKCKVKRENVR